MARRAPALQRQCDMALLKDGSQCFPATSKSAPKFGCLHWCQFDGNWQRADCRSAGTHMRWVTSPARSCQSAESKNTRGR